MVEIGAEQLPGAGHLRQDDRGLGPRPAGRRDVLDLALGDARPLLSTPLTVCLAVLGKYVPSLSFFATLLGEEAELEPDVRFYQRLVALDRDGAVEVVEAALKQRPRVEVFDQVLVPALSRAERDAARGELGDTEQEFVWRVIGEILDKTEGMPDSSPPSPEPPQ